MFSDLSSAYALAANPEIVLSPPPGMQDLELPSKPTAGGGAWDIESISKMVEVSSLKLVRSIPLAGREMLWTEISGGKSVMILGSLCSKMKV